MKKLAITQFSVLAFVSGFITWIIFKVGILAQTHWYYFFYDGNAKAPEITTFAARYGYFIPLVCCLSSIIGIVLSIKIRNLPLLWRAFTVIVIAELLGLTFFSVFIFLPSAKIMYRIM